jgi:phosphate-selective porin OprO/OprP
MKTIMRASLLAALMAGVAQGALAQTAEERIAALEAKIAALTGELADIKAVTVKAEQERKKAATTAIANGRPTLSTGDGQKFAVRTAVQFDAAAYNERGGPTDLNSGLNFRRARLGVEGTFAKTWNYALMAELGGSGNESAQLNQAYVEYTGWKPAGLANPIRLRVGAWATPAGLEDATSFTEALFMERAAAAEVMRNIAGGDGRSGVGAFANGERWYASVALTGAPVGTPAAPEFDEQVGVMTRVAFSPVGDKDWAVHVGGNFQEVLRVTDTAAGAAKVRQVRLRDRPEIRVDGTRLIDTGNINADGVTAYGAELGFFYKSLQVSAEALRMDVDRPSAFNPSFDGWYVQGAWSLTGEHRVWSSQNGGFRGIKPAKNFDPAENAWGAVEIAARYSVLDLDDGAGVRGAATPAGGVRGGEQKIASAVLNWYPNPVYRFQVQYQRVDIDRLSATGVQVGDDADIVSFRSQFAF